jgi:acyl-coenzyme A synthetase/AMP-(fatty) acid ligase
MMYRNPAIHEVCVISALHEHRGKMIKAFVVREGQYHSGRYYRLAQGADDGL